MNFPGNEVLGVYRFYIGWYMKHGIMEEFEGLSLDDLITVWDYVLGVWNGF